MPSPRTALIALAGAGLAGSGGGIVAQDRPFAADLAEVYRVGGLSAPAWAQFVDPDRMGFDAAGNLYVLDERVVVIGPGGDLLRIVGRKGEGPGEFRTATDIVVWRDGSVAVVDIGHLAYQLFGSDGRLERFIRMSSAAGAPGMAAVRGRVRPDPAGDAVIAEGGGLAAALISSREYEFQGMQVDVVGEDGKLERLDLSGDVAVAELIARARRIVPVSVQDAAPYFSPRVIWDVFPDGTIAYFDSTAYEINLVDADGGAKGVLGRPLRPEAVTDGVRSAMIEHRIEVNDEIFERIAGEEAEAMSPEDLEEMREVREWQREAIGNREFYPEVPILRGLRATWNGSLWVQRRGADPWNDDGPIDVLGPYGEYRGTLAPGEPGMPLAFGPDGLIAFLERDEMDVPTIVVKRLPAGVR